MFLTVHYHYSNLYSKVQQLFAKIWYGHGRAGRTASDGLVFKMLTFYTGILLWIYFGLRFMSINVLTLRDNAGLLKLNFS